MAHTVSLPNIADSVITSICLPSGALDPRVAHFDVIGKTPISALQEFCSKKKIQLEFSELFKEEQKIFQCTVKLAGMKWGWGVSAFNEKKTAKHIAANETLKLLIQSYDGHECTFTRRLTRGKKGEEPKGPAYGGPSLQAQGLPSVSFPAQIKCIDAKQTEDQSNALSSNNHMRTSGANEIQKGNNNLPMFRIDLPSPCLHFISSLGQLAAVKLKLKSAIILGMDTETRPNFRKGFPPNPVELLQVAARYKDESEEVFIFDLRGWIKAYSHLGDYLDECLLEAFMNPNILKVGRGFTNDLKGLSKDYPKSTCFHQVVSLLEICELNRALFLGDNPVLALSKLVAVHLKMRLSKSQQKSNWSKRPLEPKQLHYAASDALVLLKIYDALVCNEDFKEQDNVKLCPYCSHQLQLPRHLCGLELCQHLHSCHQILNFDIKAASQSNKHSKRKKRRQADIKTDENSSKRIKKCKISSPI